jgi:FKBP-type peptidyl-prolyl cis-trans isomerase (trigger factor)
MASSYKTTFDSGVKFTILTTIDSKEYSAWKERVTQRLLEQVQVDGFRKGKAPLHLAMGKIGEERILDTVFNETIQKFGVDAIKEARAELEKEDRRILEYYLDSEAATMGEKDGKFQFKIVFNILPTIDLSPIDSLTSPKVLKKDLPQRMTVEEFLENRKSFFIESANTFYTEKDPKFEKYSSFDNLLERDEEFRSSYPTAEKFTELFTRVYENETQQIEEDVKRHKIIVDTVKAIADFEMSQDRIVSEIDRIVKNIEDSAVSNNQTFTEVIKLSGLVGPEDADKDYDSVDAMRTAVEHYVKNEMKWTYIQRAIYEYKVEPKLSQEELQQVAVAMSKDPQKYDVQGGLSEEQYEATAFDKLVRNRSANWLFDTVLSVEGGKKDKVLEAEFTETPTKTKKAAKTKIEE